MATKTGLYYPTKEELDESLAARDARYTYSTSAKAVGKWIDGSVIYRKTVNFGSLPNATSKTVAHGISNLKQVIEMKGMAVYQDRYFPLPNSNPSDNTGAMRLAIEGSNIVIMTGADRSAWSAYVTIYYTIGSTSNA